MTFESMIKNELTRLNVDVILDAIRKDIDKVYLSDTFNFYDSTEIALVIYHDHIRKWYALDDIVRTFRYYRENGSSIYSGISEQVFINIGKLADEEFAEKLQQEIDAIPTFGDRE